MALEGLPGYSSVADYVPLQVVDYLEKALLVLGEIHLEEPRLLYLFFPAVLILAFALRGTLNARKKVYLFSRVTIVILLLIAAARPYTFLEEEAIEKKTNINVLLDSSESMLLFPNAESIAKNSFEEIKAGTKRYATESDLKLTYFGGGNRTALWDALYKEVLGSTKEKNVVVLVSDGVSNHGKNFASIGRLIAESNTTVYPILPGPSYADTGLIDVHAAAKIPVESDYELIVEVKKTGINLSKYDLRLFIDGKRVQRKEVKQYNETELVGFSLKFREEGLRRITFELAPSGNDFFRSNNNFSRVVEVVDKPSVLLISNEPNSPLSQILKKLYYVTEVGSIPQSFDGYAAIFVDDVAAPLLDNNIEALREFVTDGNGLVVVGGNNSYDMGDYNNSFIENILPVRSRDTPKEKRKPVTALFLIDISGSGQYTGISETTINLEKAMSIKLIKELDLNDSLGVIAFNVNAFPVSNIVPVETGRSDVIDRILRLKAGGDTDMVQALEMADDFLLEESNERVVVLFSDGIIRLTRIPSTIKVLRSLNSKGVKVYLIGIGKDNVGLGTLKYIASEAGSIFFEPEEYQRLRVSFTKEGEEEEGKVGLYLADNHHFITRNQNLDDVKIKGYNNVREKMNAQVLVSTEGGNPLLTVWRFGLGRVASLSSDDGMQWATELYSGKAAKIFPSLTNWVVGDIEGRKKTIIEADDAFYGKPTIIISRSAKPPSIKVRDPEGLDEELLAKRIGLNLYSEEYNPKTEGIYLVSAATEDESDTSGFSVNYPKEYTNLGVDLESLDRLARLSQGAFYTSGEALKLTQDVVFDVKNTSEVRSQKKNSLIKYFLAAAIGLYFLDAAARRINDILKLSRG